MAGKILLVEDHELVRETLAGILGEEGYEVMKAWHGGQALSWVKKQTPDIMITDIQMPNMNGYELLENLAKQGQDFPVLVYSSDFNGDFRGYTGKTAYISKLGGGLPEIFEALNELSKTN